MDNANPRTHARTKIVKKAKLKGFSLIEIMVALTLMGLIVGVVGVAMFNQLKKGKIDAARSQAYEIEKALDVYRLRHGSYPSSSQGLDVLVNPPKGFPIMERVPLDPWDTPYLYIFPGQKNRTKPDIRSLGPDKEESEDDVGNWPAGE